MDAPQDESKTPRRRSYSRTDHRARSHESAHAEGTTVLQPLEHPLVPGGPAAMVSTPPQFEELLGHLRKAGRFAYDSEFIGELTYFPKLCLLQVASAERVALIDPLAGLDLQPFWELLADPSVEKIVHAGEQDIEPVVRRLGRGPANLFDTQIAAGFIGMPYPMSLSKLVAELAGVKLGKGLTFTHWDQRPLSGVQLRYAADDVRYLLLVRQEIGRRLDALGHTARAAEECAAECEPSLYTFDPRTQYLRVRGAGGLPPRNLAVLRELTVWRDGAARAHDVPPRSFLRDEILLDLARNPVKNVEKLERVRGLPRPVEHAHGAEIVDATNRALALPASEWPADREDEPTPAEKFRIDTFWDVAQCLCAGQQIDPALVSNRAEMGEFYRLLSQRGPAERSRLFNGWRREVVGDALAHLMAGKSEITLRWNEGGLKASVR